MNIPPDKDGLIHDSDIKSLTEWKEMRDKIFSNNLAKDAKVFSINGINAGSILDGNDATWWTTKGKDSTASIELKLTEKKTFDVMLLQENLEIGQRIEKFELNIWNGSRWERIASGTTVGYKRILKFEPVTSDRGCIFR